MKLNQSPRVHHDPILARELREHALQVNSMAEGRLVGTYNAQTSAPTTGTHAKGDQVRNSNPSEAGSASSKYVVIGWICTVGGTPGTWLEMRVLTGN